MYTKKSLGQHFLKERRYAERLALAVPEGTKNLVEVGPGPGMLTQYLADRCSRLLLVEKDTDLAAAARKQWSENPNVTVLEDDILRVDLPAQFEGEQFVIAGNYPYNISSQIVFRALDYYDRVPHFIGMFQYEMARRIVSGPGSKEYGIISVLTAAYYSGKLLFSVPPGAFNPPPKVNSAVIHLTRKEDTQLPCSFKSLQTVVRSAFGQRRKMLRNSLLSLFPADFLSDPLFEKRPEHLDLEQFLHLAVQFEAGFS